MIWVAYNHYGDLIAGADSETLLWDVLDVCGYTYDDIALVWRVTG